jgi:hypothetical protein
MTIVKHPLLDLMTKVEAERAFADTPEAQTFQLAIAKACHAYMDYLERHGQTDFYDPEVESVAEEPAPLPALVVTYDLNGGCRIVLKGGAIDQRYGDEPEDTP